MFKSLCHRDKKTAKQQKGLLSTARVLYIMTESKLIKLLLIFAVGFGVVRACISISCVKSSTLVCNGLQYKQAARTATGSPEGETQISQSPAALRKAKL